MLPGESDTWRVGKRIMCLHWFGLIREQAVAFKLSTGSVPEDLILEAVQFAQEAQEYIQEEWE